MRKSGCDLISFLYHLHHLCLVLLSSYVQSYFGNQVESEIVTTFPAIRNCSTPGCKKLPMQGCWFTVALDYWAISENLCQFSNYCREVSLIVNVAVSSLYYACCCWKVPEPADGRSHQLPMQWLGEMHGKVWSEQLVMEMKLSLSEEVWGWGPL
jgi:hypothetical protein